MVTGEDFLLKWNDHHALFFAGAEELVSAEEYTDVTLAAGARFFAAHRLVLSICSPYFRQLFKRLGGEKTVIFLKDVEPKHLELLLEYMYKGEIKVEVSGGYWDGSIVLWSELGPRSFFKVHSPLIFYHGLL